jgi:hypothetical protein
MENEKQLGIWMDHSEAFLMELSNDTIVQNIIVSEFTHEDRELSITNRGEKHMHIKEQHLQLNFYNKLSDCIRNYTEVVLFGPTNAKDELFNLMKDDHLFKNIKIEVKHADKMTENQKHTFVREYFK